MSFLKAEWRKLVLANYEVEPDLLTEYLPYGTELDLWNGKSFISLVGFMFVNTKLLGVRIPYHINFEEVNLRFYVKRKVDDKWRRGVVFIKEIVSKPALTFVANTIYKENYETMLMSHNWLEYKDHISVQYSWKGNSNWNHIMVNAKLKALEIVRSSEVDFITEHYWGYAKVSDTKTNEYEVTRPKWEKYNVIDYDISVDFGETYGENFKFLNKLKPASVMLAEGSEITVENKKTIKNVC